MRIRLLAVLLVSFAIVGIAAAQERSAAKTDTATAKSGGNWLTRWWPFGDKSGETKDAPAKQTAPDVESAGAVRARELVTLQRRQAVCLRLKEIAVQTNDEALMQKAEQLEQRAWQVYEQRTASTQAQTEVKR